MSKAHTKRSFVTKAELSTPPVCNPAACISFAQPKIERKKRGNSSKVERCLAKAKVEGSNPFFRFNVVLQNDIQAP